MECLWERTGSSGKRHLRLFDLTAYRARWARIRGMQDYPRRTYSGLQTLRQVVLMWIWMPEPRRFT